MDKKTQNLDPALKATYERVMGTNVSQPTTPPTPQPTAPAQPTQATSSAPTSQAPQPTVTVPQGSSAAKVVAGGSTTTNVVAGGSKKSGGLSPILIAVALILFFTVYTFVWLFVFKVKLPFVPKLF